MEVMFISLFHRLSVCYIQIMGLHSWLLAPMLFISCGNGNGATEILAARLDQRILLSSVLIAILCSCFLNLLFVCPVSLLHLLHLTCGNQQMGF